MTKQSQDGSRRL